MMDREFEKTFERLCVTRTPRSVWDDFVALSAIAISNELDFRDDREELEASILEKYSNQEIWMMQELFDRTADVLEKNPNQDYLGELFSQFQWSKDEGLYLTPYDEAKSAAQFCLEQTVANPFTSLRDPNCGSGTMLIAAFNQMTSMNRNPHMRLFCIGLEPDFTTAMMCYIQISFLGIAGYIMTGGNLNRSLKELSLIAPEEAWCTPAYYHRTWQARRLAKYIQDL